MGNQCSAYWVSANRLIRLPTTHWLSSSNRKERWGMVWESFRRAYHSKESCQAATRLAKESWLIVSDYPAKKEREKQRERRGRWVGKGEDKHILGQTETRAEYNTSWGLAKVLEWTGTYVCTAHSSCLNTRKETQPTNGGALWKGGRQCQFPWCGGEIHQNCSALYQAVSGLHSCKCVQYVCFVCVCSVIMIVNSS